MTTQNSQYEFLKSKTNTKNDGNDNLRILISYNSMMHYLRRYDKDKSVAYYRCSKEVTTGCKATAVVHKIEDQYIVHKCADLDDHNHEGDVVAVLCEKILNKMAEKVQCDPSKKLKVVHDEVLDSFETDYGSKDVWEKVLSALGTEEARIQRLRRIRNKTKDDANKPKNSVEPKLLVSNNFTVRANTHSNDKPRPASKPKPLMAKDFSSSSATPVDCDDDPIKDWNQVGGASPSYSMGDCNDDINNDDDDDTEFWSQSEVPKKEMLRLHCNSFEMNIYNSWQNFQNEDDLSDVTIACDDDPSHQIQAHKIILSSFSPIFRNLVRLNPGHKSVLYLRGVKYNELVNIMNFIYKGEVNIVVEDVNNFIALAQDLKIKGLSEEMIRKGELENLNNEIKYPFDNETKTPEKNKTLHTYINKEKIDTSSTKKETPWSILKMDISNCDTNLGNGEKDPAVNDDEEIARLAWEATMLDQEDENIDDRSKKKETTLYFNCEYCNYKTPEKCNLQQHMDSMHEGVSYFCDQCTFKTPKRYKLAQHMDSMHEGSCFKCDCCEYISTKKRNLKRHIEKMHSPFR